MRNSLPLLILPILFLAIAAQANEQTDAAASCLTAQEAIQVFDKQNHVQNSVVVSKDVCERTTRTAEQWNCVTQSIINGNAPFYSADQCFRSDPNTIVINKDEQNKAMEICMQVVQLLKSQQSPSVDSVKNTCMPFRFAHNTKEWSCVRDDMIQGNDFHFASSKCFINPPEYIY